MTVRILVGDALARLQTLDSESVQVCVTSPPYYGLRDYGVDGQIGLEQTPAEFISRLLAVFEEVRRVLRPDGLCFVNIGSSYAGSGRGPTGKNGIGNQTKRQGFVGAGDSDPSRSLSLGHAPACDSDGRGRSDSHRPDSAYSDLCDGCLADFLSHRERSADTFRPLQPAEPLPSLTSRGSEHQDLSLALSADVPLVAPASTTLESWRRLRGSCSRCDSRGASFARLGLPTDGHAAPGCAHMTDDLCADRSTSSATQDRHGSTGCNGATDDASAGRIGDKDADSVSYPYSTIADRHWKPKDLIMIPEMFALGMQERGWYVRSCIVWAKTSAMPESVRDRPTSAWEPIWMFAKSRTYFWDQEAVRQPTTSAPQRRMVPKRIGLGPYTQNGGFDPRSDPAVDAPDGGANLRNVWTLGPEPQGAFKWSERVPVSVDDADDDTERTTSPDCPVHASRPASTSRRGGPLDDPLSRNPRNGTGRVQAPLVADAPTEGQSLERPETAPSLGDLAATPHSTPSSKTGQRAETTPPDSASSETIHRTAHTSTQPAVGSLHLDMAESSISMGDLVVHPSPRTGSDTARTPSVRRTSSPCTCSYSKVIIRESAHFAQFPTEIPRRCILAGTSEKGACPSCAAPWVRVIEKGGLVSSGPNQIADKPSTSRHTSALRGAFGPDGYGDLPKRERTTTGWAPSCQCDAGAPVPQTVLDPFGGSGTTALAADRLGRSSILIELSPTYAEMAQRRLDRDAPMLSEPAHLDTAWQQPDLFAEAVS